MDWLAALVPLALWQVAEAGADDLGSCCGREVGIEAEPFLASLQRLPEGHVCSATLLTTCWLLTAAQCLVDEQGEPRPTVDYFVLMGSANVVSNPRAKEEQRGSPRLFVLHPMFNTDGSIDYDLGMIRLRAPMGMTRRVSLVTLPSDSVSTEALQKRNCTVVGWAQLQKPRTNNREEWRLIATEKLKIRSSADCADRSHRNLRDNVHLCTVCDCPNHCHGGSGSALMCHGVQLGVVSFMESCPTCRRCVYARLDTQLPWLLQVTSSGSLVPRLPLYVAAASCLHALILASP